VLLWVELQDEAGKDCTGMVLLGGLLGAALGTIPGSETSEPE
jgi:hypothetical protein